MTSGSSDRATAFTMHEKVSLGAYHVTAAPHWWQPQPAVCPTPSVSRVSDCLFPFFYHFCELSSSSSSSSSLPSSFTIPLIPTRPVPSSSLLLRLTRRWFGVLVLVERRFLDQKIVSPFPPSQRNLRQSLPRIFLRCIDSEFHLFSTYILHIPIRTSSYIPIAPFLHIQVTIRAADEVRLGDNSVVVLAF